MTIAPTLNANAQLFSFDVRFGEAAIGATRTASGGAPDAVTPAQLRQIMPQAGPQANLFADALNIAMRTNGIVTVPQKAAFLAHVAVESGQLRWVGEKLNYSAVRLTEAWPKRFPSLEFARQFAGHPEKIANFVYANRNEIGDVASGDGWRFRGRGLIQTTGRANYRAIGLENNPERLRTVDGASESAAKFLAQNGLVSATRDILHRADFDATTRKLNGGMNNANERWHFYQSALRILGD